MKRFFAFGCSFTKYLYPTYADLISLNFDFYENWGQGGAGNHYIFNSFIEANQRHNFHPGDTIIIQWTNTGREDRYLNDSWIGDGNIYSQTTYDDEWVKKFVTERGCLVRDLAFIKACYLILKSIGCNFQFISMVPLYKHNEWKDSFFKNHDDVYKLYKDVIEVIRPSYYEIIFKGNWSLDITYQNKPRDQHPSPLEHLQYVEKILPEYQITQSMQQLAIEKTEKFFGNKKTYFKHKPLNRL